MYTTGAWPTEWQNGRLSTVMVSAGVAVRSALEVPHIVHQPALAVLVIEAHPVRDMGVTSVSAGPDEVGPGVACEFLYMLPPAERAFHFSPSIGLQGTVQLHRRIGLGPALSTMM